MLTLYVDFLKQYYIRGSSRVRQNDLQSDTASIKTVLPMLFINSDKQHIIFNVTCNLALFTQTVLQLGRDLIWQAVCHKSGCYWSSNTPVKWTNPSCLMSLYSTGAFHYTLEDGFFEFRSNCVIKNGKNTSSACTYSHVKCCSMWVLANETNDNNRGIHLSFPT